MCRYYSFAVDVLDPMVVYVGDGENHGGIEAKFSLKPGDYRECEWIAEGPESLVVRGESLKESGALKEAMLARWPMRAQLIAYVVPRLKKYDKAVATAEAAYNKAVAPAEAAYDKALATARAAYNKAVATAGAAYKKSFVKRGGRHGG